MCRNNWEKELFSLLMPRTEPKVCDLGYFEYDIKYDIRIIFILSQRDDMGK